MKEKVDILLATYNANETYLKKQIDSILKQTYSNFHLIISDDASTDNKTVEILKEYEDKNHRITVILQKENRGYLKNFEFLLKESTAEYIMFSDQDDIWHEDKIEKSLKKLKETNASLVYSDATQIGERDELLHKSYITYKNMPFLRGKQNIQFFTRHTVIRLFTNVYQIGKRKNATI